MPSLKRAYHYLLHDPRLLLDAIVKHSGRLLPDKLYLSLRYRLQMGEWVNWKHPETFTEKLQWLKVYDRKPQYTQMVDKYAVKQYVADKIGDDYIIPTLGAWERPEDIDWDSLPEQFVLKATNGGGSNAVVICTDKAHFDRKAAIAKLREGLKSDIYKTLREWPYKNVKRQVIAEKYLDPVTSQDLPDYKFFCFDGEPQYCQVIRDRHTKEAIDFYDMEWSHMPFIGLNPAAVNGATPVARPPHLETMKAVCRKLAQGTPFLRVDLYVVSDKEYFGELTFYPASGMGRFTPEEWNKRLGDLITLGH